MRRLSIIDLDQAATSRSPTRTAASQVVQNGEIYNYRELRDELRAARPPLRHATATPRCSCTSTRSTATGFVERLRGMFAIALWDARAAAACCSPATASGSSRSTTASPTATLSFASELKALLEQPGFSREIDPAGARGLPRLQLDPGAADDLRRGAQAAAGPPARLARRRGQRSRATRARRRSPAERRAPRAGGRARGRAARAPARLGPRPPGRRRAGRRAALRRRRLGGAHRAGRAPSAASRCSTFSIGFEESGFDELDRARLVAERYGTDHHELILRPDAVELLPRLVEAFDEPFGDSSALPTYLVSQLAGGHGQGRALGRGRRRALRRLLHLRRRPARPARRHACAALARPLVEALPSSDREGRASTTRRSGSSRGAAPAAARAPPRLEGDLLAERAGLAARRSATGLGPARPATASATRRPRAPRSWRASRTSTSASTWSTTCW